MEQPPHPMLLGDDEGDYYRGTFKSAPAQAQPGTSHSSAGTTTEGGQA
jgi:hypothetical protein